MRTSMLGELDSLGKPAAVLHAPHVLPRLRILAAADPSNLRSPEKLCMFYRGGCAFFVDFPCV